MNISFSPPDISDLERQMVDAVLRSGWITTGPKTKELERRLAAYVGVPRCVCLNSQTACAEMALRLLGIGEGDEVIVPAYTYTATVSVVCHVGAKPVMVDCQKDSLEMDYEAVARAVTARTKAIIPVDLAGIPCDDKRIMAIVEGKKALFSPKTPLQARVGRVAVCADAAHAFGAERGGRRVGSIADFTSFSFHAVKNLTTAEGGALCWRSLGADEDEAIYKQIQLFSLHGQSKDALAKTRLGAWEYDIVGPWYKCNMTDIMAAIGLAQLSRYPGMLARRAEIIRRYDEALNPLGIRSLAHYGADYRSSGHLYLSFLPGASPEQRQAVMDYMGEAGVACNVHYKPLPMMTAYKRLGFRIEDYPHAYAHFAGEISLPLHTLLTDTELQYVIDSYRAALCACGITGLTDGAGRRDGV